MIEQIFTNYTNGNFDDMAEQITDYKGGRAECFEHLKDFIIHYGLKPETFMKITIMYFKKVD